MLFPTIFAEWLRKKDHEMIFLENDYLDILMRNMDALRDIWAIS